MRVPAKIPETVRMSTGLLRVIYKQPSLTRLTVWSGGSDSFPVSGGCLAVEFRGRLGHPSSYGLLAGEIRATGGVVLDLATLPYLPDVGTGCDTIVHGLVPEYEEVVIRTANLLGVPLRLTAACHGELGSSVAIFSRLTAVLITLLSDLDTSPADLWRIWSSWPE